MVFTTVLNKMARVSGPAILLGSLRRGSAPLAFMRHTHLPSSGRSAGIALGALSFRTEGTLMLSAVINLWRHKQPLDVEALMFADAAASLPSPADLSRLIWDFTYD